MAALPWIFALPKLLLGGLLGGFVFSPLRLNYKTVSNGLGADRQSGDFSIHNRPHLLGVWFEFSFGNAGDFLADAAQILGFTATGNAAAAACLLACKITYSCHHKTPKKLFPAALGGTFVLFASRKAV